MTVTVKDLAWAAGFIEGEGTFWCHANTPTVRASQVQREPLERLLKMFGGKIGYYANGKNRPRHQWIHTWYVNGKRAAEVAMTLYGMLSPRRQEQAKKVLDIWKKTPVSYVNRDKCVHGHEYAPRVRANGATGRYCPTCQAARAKIWRVQQEQRPSQSSL